MKRFMSRLDDVKRFYENYDFSKLVSDPPSQIKEFIDKEILYLKDVVGKNNSILEIGCGYGRMFEYLKPDKNNVFGIDYSLRMIKKAQTLNGKSQIARLCLMRAEKLGFEDNAFDIVLCLNATFGNMPGIEIEVLREMKRVVKKGGAIALTFFSEKARDAQLKNYARLGFKIRHETQNAIMTEEGLYSRRFSKSDLKKLFRESGINADIASFCPIGYFAILYK